MEVTEEKIFPNEDDFKIIQREKLLTNLFHLYEQGMLCDLTMLCGNTSFKVHRCILAASSPYYYDLLKVTSIDSISLPLNASVAEAFLKYCYTGTMQFNEFKVLDILIPSYIFQFNEIYESYIKCLPSINANEIIHVWKEAKENNKTISNALLKICSENLEVLLETNKIGSFSKELLQEILEIKNSTSSFLKLKTIVNWIRADKLTRKTNYQELLSNLDSTVFSEPTESSCIDFSKFGVEELILNYEFLLLNQQAANPDIIKKSREETEKKQTPPTVPLRPSSIPINEELDDSVQLNPPAPPPRKLRTPSISEEPKKQEAPPLPPKSLIAKQPPTIPPRKISNQYSESVRIPEPHLGIFAVTKSQTIIFQNYNIIKNAWSFCETVTLPLNYMLLPAITVAENQMYLIGGSDNKGYLAHVFTCKISEFSIKPLKSMNLPRVHCGVGFLNGLIYVLGGRNTTGWLSEVERYDPKTNTWENVASLSETKSALGVTSYGDYLYAVGGLRDEKNFSYLVEQYNPEVNQWTKLAPLLFGRYRFGIGAYNGFLFILGGTREGQTKNGEDDFIQYNIKENIWSILSCPDNFHDDQPCILTYSNLLWVISRRTFSIFFYDTSNGTWAKLETLNSTSNWQYIKNVIMYYK